MSMYLGICWYHFKKSQLTGALNTKNTCKLLWVSSASQVSHKSFGQYAHRNHSPWIAVIHRSQNAEKWISDLRYSERGRYTLSWTVPCWFISHLWDSLDRNAHEGPLVTDTWYRSTKNSSENDGLHLQFWYQGARWFQLILNRSRKLKKNVHRVVNHVGPDLARGALKNH